MNRFTAVIVVIALALVAAPAAEAACMNKFVVRTEGPRQVVTILTGKLTFQEAKQLADSITGKTHPPIEWVDGKGKSIAKQFGDLKVVRPMPVGCDGKASGVVMTLTLVGTSKPSNVMQLKLDESTLLRLEEQAN